MLRVAVPNKGALAEAAAQMLRESGYRQRSASRDLVCVDPDNDIEFYYLRPKDIAVYVGEGTLDVGITGRDFLHDVGSPAHEVLALGFGGSTFRFAGPADGPSSVKELHGLRIATDQAGLVAAHLAEHGVEATIVRLEGAVENAVRLGVADVIADVVETGATLRQAGLVPFGDPVVVSEAVLIARESATEFTRRPDAALMLRRLQGVLVARDYVLVDYDIDTAGLEEATRLTPGFESPTVSPLRKDGWVAVRSMVPRTQAQRVMDDLWEIGARAILVTEIHACRL